MGGGDGRGRGGAGAGVRGRSSAACWWWVGASTGGSCGRSTFPFLEALGAAGLALARLRAGPGIRGTPAPAAISVRTSAISVRTLSYLRLRASRPKRGSCETSSSWNLFGLLLLVVLEREAASTPQVIPKFWRPRRKPTVIPSESNNSSFLNMQSLPRTKGANLAILSASSCEMFFRNSPRQQNLWVCSGSGRFPSV